MPRLIKMESKESNEEPKPDIGKCFSCDWSGNLDLCELDEDGSYEEGYYMVHVCPSCQSKGTVEPDMSKQQYEKWQEWRRSL